ncbi:MAG: OmpA family protein [Saprospiraceae bacterium]|jgi:outer membrane protein OmpA-like peptidoglycan-associated protein|nr:OmpA family protein [Saprospiraceae bacterium]MBK7373145.1 OmpA family protein [Saprospiraceae bacterium]MBK7439905.1 OmpA family protein [Saprospiraceae bacterium]MBK8280377.1 OmpA family protein [Saprospiraceae bacterium]MBK8513160.1 OmpA family protein [Saprospiraceae bacterium]
MNNILSRFGIYSYCFLSLIAQAYSQSKTVDSIRLVNASFEDTPKQSSPPMGWTDCGFTGESAPDVHPSNFWQVSKPAFNGRTYMGLVVRHNDTWERVSQMLESPLVGGQCYNFSIYLSSSEQYRSGTNNRDLPIPMRLNDTVYNFDIPAVLRIWGGNISCGRSELLAESDPVDHFEWKQYSFRIKPKTNYKYIMLEAFFKTPVLFPYNGNILLDNASAFVPVPCNAPVEPPKTTAAVAKPKPPVLPAPAVTPPANQSSAHFVPKPKVGEIIKINNLYFTANSDSIPPNSLKALDDIFDYLMLNQTLVVEIGGHTNGLPKDDFCDSLSLLRAKAVAEYLTVKGIPKERMTYVGYGRRKPVDTNATREGRAKNQRVELKILSS